MVLELEVTEAWLQVGIMGFSKGALEGAIAFGASLGASAVCRGSLPLSIRTSCLACFKTRTFKRQGRLLL